MKKILTNLTFWVLTAITTGALLGHFLPEKAVEFKWLGTRFIDVVKLFINPIIFLTISLGISGMGDLKKVGKVGLKALIYFEIVTTFALLIGILVANIIQPGAGVTTSNLGGADLSEYTSKAQEFSWLKFLKDNFTIQVLIFSIAFGIFLSKYKKKESKEAFTMANYLDKIGSVMTSQIGKNVNKSMRPTFENFMSEKNLDKLVKESLQPTISKKDLLSLLKNRINEDFYFGESEMMEDFEFMAEPAIKEPATKPKTPTEKPKEKPRRKPSRETPYENPETRPQGEDEDFDLDMMDFEFMAEPAIKEPGTKPKTPTKTPEREKPRRKSSRETPYENPETRPQGLDDEDFVMERLFRKVKNIL